METTPYWKKIWLTISGRNKNVTCEDAANVLRLVGDDLCLGILKYKTFTQTSFEEWKSAIDLKDKDNILETFVRRLTMYLDLETASTWKVFCNFLMFEYYGKVVDIKKIAEYEMYSKHLFQHIWLFYSSERMFIIKTMKYMLEKSLDEHHRFHDLYSNYLKPPKLGEIRVSLLRQFKYLINEIHVDNVDHCTEFSDWVDRNMREQIEVLSSMILTVEYSPLSIDEYKELFQLFKEHNFGKDPNCYQSVTAMNPINLMNLKTIEVGLLLLGLMPCWESSAIWHPHADELENIVLGVLRQGECGIVLLAWATLQMTLPERIAQEKFTSHYYKFTKLALQQRVFVSLYEMAANSILEKCLVGKIIKTAMYVLLEQVCDKFNENGIVLVCEKSAALVAELIAVPEIAERFIRSGCYALYENSTRLFPLTFDSYSLIANALLSYPELFETVSGNLMDLKQYTEEYTRKNVCLDEGVTAMVDYRPNGSGDIVVPEHSEASVFRRFDKILITYKTRYTYFNVLEDLINDIIGKHETSDTTSIYSGLKLMNTLLHNSEKNLIPLRKCFNLVTAVFGKFTTQRPLLDFKLVEICVKIYISLMEVDDVHIMEILTVNNFLPDVVKDPTKVENYFHKSFFAPGILFTAIHEEIATRNCQLLFAFIKFLKDALRRKHHQLKIQAPGVVLLFVHVFPAHLGWNYRDIRQKCELTYECMKLLFEILQQNYALLTTKLDKVIYDFCYEVITSYEPVLHVFMRLLQVPNVYLHAHMDKEFNWTNVASVGVIKTVKTCLSIVLLLFTKHIDAPKSLFTTSFSKFFFKSDGRPSMLKVIAGHINHGFDESVPKLACQLLKKFAAYSELPMLALLEMDYYQVQCMFLEKLRDPLEDEMMKVAILDFITLCIDKQNGMTAAFFNISKTYTTSSTDNEESVITFMQEYLQNIRQSTDYLRSPIQAAVLDLFHKLWICKKDILVRGLTLADEFWSTLTDPLFQELTLRNRTYSQIYNILTLELFRTKGTNTEISQVLRKMFVDTKGFVQKWTEYVIGALEEPTPVSYGSCLLTSWKNVLISALKYCPSCFENPDVRHVLTQNCLDGLVQHFSYPDDVRILTDWAELYLYLVTLWPTTYYKDCKEMLTTLTRIYKFLGEYYADVGQACKEAMLSIAIKTVQDLKRYVHQNRLLVDDYLHSIGKILEKEYVRVMTVENVDADALESDKAYTNWLLLLVFGNKLMQLGFARSHPTWFKFVQFLDKVLTSIGSFIRVPVCFPIAKMSVQCLINYAQSPLLRDFLSVSLEPFFDLTIPPQRYFNTQELNFKNATPWYFEEWWLTYSGVVQLMTLLIQKFGHFMLNTFFSYIHIHYDILKHSLILPTVTAEFTALQLVSACLKFFHTLLEWKKEWKLYDPFLFFSYLQSINHTINAVCNIFIRPRILKIFTIDKESKLTLVDKVPLTFIVAIMNQLMEILGLCNVCLIRSGADLVALLEPIKPTFVDDVSVYYDFHVPRIYEEHPERLNYGTILCILHFLCKTISHINIHKLPDKVPHKFEEDETETGFIAFVCPDFVGCYTISERYNSVQTFAASEISGISAAPWLAKLDAGKVSFATETLNTFLASQIFLTMHVRYVKYNDLQHIKRELCSELLFFHEFIRKRMVEQCQYRVVENTIYRKSLPTCLPYHISTSDKDKVLYAIRSIHSRCIDDIPHHEHRKDLQANVFYSADDFQQVYPDTEIVATEASHLPIEDTGGKISNNAYRNMFFGRRSWPDGCSTRVPIEQISLSYPTGLPFAEGDYLLLLSHWFIFICHLSH